MRRASKIIRFAIKAAPIILPIAKKIMNNQRAKKYVKQIPKN
ncbi:hypothetical protein [Bacillus sp. FJAT-50079]|nr:hypothetical protein [Bacillus sp. FJAT-50079]